MSGGETIKKEPGGMTFGWSDFQFAAERAAEQPVVTHHRVLCKSGPKAPFVWHSSVLSPGF